MKNTGGN